MRVWLVRKEKEKKKAVQQLVKTILQASPGSGGHKGLLQLLADSLDNSAIIASPPWTLGGQGFCPCQFNGSIFASEWFTAVGFCNHGAQQNKQKGKRRRKHLSSLTRMHTGLGVCEPCSVCSCPEISKTVSSSLLSSKADILTLPSTTERAPRTW